MFIWSCNFIIDLWRISQFELSNLTAFDLLHPFPPFVYYDMTLTWNCHDIRLIPFDRNNIFKNDFFHHKDSLSQACSICKMSEKNKN